MAMYEDKGYCPNNAFLHYQEKGKFWEKTETILGDRTGYMVYEGNHFNPQDPCIVPALAGGEDSVLGIEVATVLRCLIPKCVYAEQGLPILCKDVLNPKEIPFVGETFQNADAECEYEYSENANLARDFLFEDKRYLVGIHNAEEAIFIYLYKK